MVQNSWPQNSWQKKNKNGKQNFSNLKNKLICLELQRKMKSQDASMTQEELRRVSLELRKLDQDLGEKKEEIDKLNRELRKVNLQSFVRESAPSSKVGYLVFFFC